MNRLFAFAESLKQRFVKEVVATEAETAFLFVDGTFREILKPGRHRFAAPDRTRVEKVAHDDPLVRFADIASIHAKPEVARHTTSVRVDEGHLGLVFRRGVFFSFLAPGLHVFAGAQETSGLTFETEVKAAGAELKHPAEPAISSHVDAAKHLKVVRVDAGNLGMLYVDGVLARPLLPGRHALLETGHALRVDTAKPFEPISAPDRAALLAHPALAGRLVSAEVNDDERGLVFAGENFRRFLSPGAHLFLKTSAPETRVTIVRTSEAAFEHPALAAIRRSPDAGAFLTTYNVGQGHIGLLFVDGEYKGRLGPGAYSYFNGQRHTHVELVDMRELGAEVTGQELLTQDKVSLRLNVSVRYRITDPEKAILGHAGHADAFHRILQLALREETQKSTFDDLLARKDDLGKNLVERASEGARALGIEVVSAGLRDVILPGEMRTILNQVVEAERRAQANLITRREEVAATRSLLNTARLLDENPTLLRLKELEHAERIAEKIGQLTVIGGIDAIVPKIREVLTEKKP